MNTLITLNKELEDNIKCKGLTFRGKLNAFINNKNEYIYQERMSLLKRKSCTGCPECGYLMEILSEDVDSNILPIIDNIIHNQLYKLNIVNMYKDPETGYVDDFDLEFYLIKEN